MHLSVMLKSGRRPAVMVIQRCKSTAAPRYLEKKVQPTTEAAVKLDQTVEANTKVQPFQTNPKVQVVDYNDLMAMDATALATLERAFIGESAFGVVGINNIPGYTQARREMFDAAADLGFNSENEEARKRHAGVRQTYPGWNGTPGRETHPLQSNFLHNIKEDVGNCAVDTYYGKNVWPSEEYKSKFVAVNKRMYKAALQVLKGCDILVRSPEDEGRLSNYEIATNGTTLAG